MRARGATGEGTGSERGEAAAPELLASLPTEGPVVAEVADGVGTVTLNRPDQRNALNGEVLSLLPRVVATLDADDAVAAIVLTGADPAFCAGVDLRALAAGDTALVLPRDQRGPLPPRRTPVIGAINGPAVTGGLELALACDLLVASERATFADTHARVGIMPGWGLTVLLPQAVGLRRAREMSLTGNYVDAPTALAWGLVNHVVAHDQVVAAAQGLGRDIASAQPAAVAQLLDSYERTSVTTVDEAWEIEGTICRAWSKAQLDPSKIAEIREQVIARGRAQQRS